MLLMDRTNRCLPWIHILWETALAAATSGSSSRPTWNGWWWVWSCRWSCQRHRSCRRSATPARRRAGAEALHEAATTPLLCAATAALHGTTATTSCRATAGLGTIFPLAGHLHGAPLHQQLGGEGRKGRGGDRSKTGVAAPTAGKGMDWLWWRDRLALARAATIWRARSERERGRPAHTRSAMKRLKLSVRVSHAFRRLGNAARVVSWGRNAFLLSSINLLAMSAFLLRCPSN